MHRALLVRNLRLRQVQLAYADRLRDDPALVAKVRADGAGRRPAGTPDGAPRRDVRR